MMAAFASGLMGGGTESERGGGAAGCSLGLVTRAPVGRVLGLPIEAVVRRPN
jgi:hypothetical protein